MKTTWSARIIKLSSTARLLSASVTAKGLAVSVRAGVIALKAIVGKFLTFLELNEEFAAHDSAALAVRKGLQDSISALGILTQEFRKARQDGTQVSDAAFRSAIKVLTEAAGVADHEYRGFAKVLNDGASFLDAYRIAYTKSFSDTARFSDTQKRDITKGKADAFVAADRAAISLSRSFADSFGAMDLATRILTKGLFDDLHVTDDVDGQASIDDDQEVNFVKVISQQALTADEFFRVMAFVRAYQEGSTVSDLSSLGMQKPFTDSTKAQDTYAHVFSKNTIESLRFNDATTLGIGSHISETAIAADLFSFLMQTARADQFQVSDFSLAEFGKAPQDALTLSDSFSRTAEFSRPFDDTASISTTHRVDFSMVQDDVYMAGFDYFAQDYVDDGDRFFVRDLCAPAMNKGASDTARFSDLINTRQLGKGLNDTPRFSDAYSRSLTKLIVESFTATDDFDGNASTLDDEKMSFTKNRSEAASITDAMTYLAQFYRSPAETAQMQDAIARQCGKPFADAMRVIESRSLGVGRPAADAFTVTDTSFRGPGKGRTDQATFTDTGSLRSQGYSDFSYFAEDFVGASRTF